MTLLSLLNGNILAQSEILGHTFLGTFEGHAYYLSDCPTTWVTAAEVAKQMGGYLAAITSEAEDDFIASFPISYENYSCNDYTWCELAPGSEDCKYFFGGAWIGLVSTFHQNNCSHWQWDNNEQVIYTNWAVAPVEEPIHDGCGMGVFVGKCWCVSCGTDYGVYRWRTAYYDVNNSFYFNVASYIVEFEQDPGCGNPNKSYICHNGNTICVNNDAVQTHLNHGDYAGPCGPCNSNSFQTVPENIPVAEYHEVYDIMPNAERPDDNTSPKAEIILYPNPTNDIINITVPKMQNDGLLRVLTLTGRTILSQRMTSGVPLEIDLTNFQAGVYVLDVQSADERWQRKVVKL